jgi:drug/metabolite transporter (DMT)-like permease
MGGGGGLIEASTPSAHMASGLTERWHTVPMRRLPPLVALCLLATWLVWGSTYLAIKFALLSFPPFFQMGSRFVCAGLLLAAWMRWRGAPWPQAAQWRRAALVGALTLGGGMGGTAYAEQSVASGLVVAFVAVVPATIALMGLFFGQRLRPLEWCGIGVGALGILALSQGGGFQGSPTGLLAIALACLCWSLGTVLSLHRLPLAPGGMGFASEMLCGGVLLLLSVLTGERMAWPPSGPALAAWLYLVVFGSLIAFSAYRLLLDRASASLASSYAYVNPLVAMLLGVWLGQETVTALEWTAATVVVLGVGLLLVRPKAG